MKPIGPLMREHRLIERMVDVLAKISHLAAEHQKVEPILVATAIDFFQTYAEHTHFDKEEDLLFRKLAEKKLSPDHSRVMQELLEEHAQLRKMSSALRKAGEGYSPADPASLLEILGPVNDLAGLYPPHMNKEDKAFFYPSLEYLSNEEQNAMLDQFWEFDRKLVHEIYLKAVEKAEAGL